MILPRPRPPSDNDTSTGDVTLSPVVDVKPDDSPPRKKGSSVRRKPRKPSAGKPREASARNKCSSAGTRKSFGKKSPSAGTRSPSESVNELQVKRRKPSARKKCPSDGTRKKKNPSAGTQNPSESVDELLGQLVNAYCGKKDHPANCQDCNDRIEAIRALLRSNEKCHKDSDAGDHLTAVPSTSQDGLESGDAKPAGAGLFCCDKCPDRFETYAELQKHDKVHATGKKQCNICQRILSAKSSMRSVSRLHFITLIFYIILYTCTWLFSFQCSVTDGWATECASDL